VRLTRSGVTSISYLLCWNAWVFFSYQQCNKRWEIWDLRGRSVSWCC